MSIWTNRCDQVQILWIEKVYFILIRLKVTKCIQIWLFNELEIIKNCKLIIFFIQLT